MRSKNSNSTFRTWLMVGLIAVFTAACGGRGEGRDPILGIDGNVAAPPLVTATSPAPGAVGVAIDIAAVTATFSEPMAPLTGGATYTLTCAAPCVSPTGTVTLNTAGTIASFTLDAPLQNGTMYTGTITGARSQLGVALEQPFTWSFTTASGAPVVTVVSPLDNATGVATDAVITAQFNEPVEALDATDFTVTCTAPCTNPVGTVSMNAAGTIATFTVTGPASLEELTDYTATIVTATSAVTGMDLAAPFVWNFTTIAPPPTVTAVAPVNNATGVAVNNTVITAQFSEPVTALANSAFTVTCALPCTNPTGVVSMNGAGTIATFTVSAPGTLEDLTLYTATVNAATSVATGRAMQAPFVWRFTTGVTPDTTRPRVVLTEPLTTDPGPTLLVPTNTAITAVFSEDMAPLTIGDASFTLTCELPCVSPPGSVSYVVGSRTAVFLPDAELESATVYTATILSTATDLAGNQLAGNQAPIANPSDYVWTFTTETAVPADNISVLSTVPIDGGDLEVCPNAAVSATFDVPSGLRLDPLTVNSLTFRVVEDATPLNVVVADSVVLDVATGQIITFTPQNELTEGLVYRATLTGGSTGVKDLAVPGNEMLNDFVWTFTVVPAVISCLEPVPLNSAAPFGAFGGTAGMTNDGILTIINGDIGTTAVSTAVTGFVGADDANCTYTVVPGDNEGLVNGNIFTSPPPPTPACPQDGTAITADIANQARLDAEQAFIALSPAAMPGGLFPGNDNLASLTLAPGIWTAQSGAFMIEGGDLTLDGQGNLNAVWVFQMATTLTVGGPGAAAPQSIILINGAQAKNVFWQVGSAATINAAGGGTVEGTIIAASGVAISTTGLDAPNQVVTLNGRALSLGASVTMNNTIVNVPAP